MSENPYTAPTTKILQPTRDGMLSTRPKQIVYAVALLWVGLLLDLPRIFIEYDGVLGDEALFIILGATLFVLAIVAFINQRVWHGASWARMVTMLFTVLYALSLIVTAFDDDEAATTMIVLDLIVLGISVVATYLLYCPPGKYWFEARDQGADH